MYLIDPPSLFAPAEEWRRFAKRMRELAAEKPNDKAVREGLKAAEEWERAQAG